MFGKLRRSQNLLLLLLMAGFMAVICDVAPLSAQDAGHESCRGSCAQIVVPSAGAVETVALSADGRTALSVINGKIQLWDVASGRGVGTLESSRTIQSAAISPDGHTALSGGYDDVPKLWDLASRREIRAFKGSPSKGVLSVAFSPDGRTALSGNYDGTIKLWDLASGRLMMTLTADPLFVFSVAFSPDGRSALSGGGYDALRLWHVASGYELRHMTPTGRVRPTTSVAFSPDGRTALSASEDKTVRLWQIASGLLLRTFIGHSGGVRSVAFSPDGRSVLSASDDKTVKLWDVESGRELMTFREHSDRVASAVFLPDGRKVLSGSGDGSLRLWDRATGRTLTASFSFWDSWLTMTPEGFFEASSPEVTRNVRIVRGLVQCSTDQAMLDRIYNILHRPDLVREKIAGDPDGKVKAAAAQLDLDKVCFGADAKED